MHAHTHTYIHTHMHAQHTHAHTHTHIHTYMHTYYYYFLFFLNSLLTGKAELQITEEEVMRTMALVKAAQDSLKLGKPVKFDDYYKS